MCVSIVSRLGVDGGCKYGLTDSVHPDIGAWHEGLKLRRAPANSVQSLEVVFTQRPYNRPNAANRFEDHLAMAVHELMYQFRDIRDQCLRHGETVPAYELC